MRLENGTACIFESDNPFVEINANPSPSGTAFAGWGEMLSIKEEIERDHDVPIIFAFSPQLQRLFVQKTWTNSLGSSRHSD